MEYQSSGSVQYWRLPKMRCLKWPLVYRREAAEAVLDLATGVKPARPVHTSHDVDPFKHPDALSRFPCDGRTSNSSSSARSAPGISGCLSPSIARVDRVACVQRPARSVVRRGRAKRLLRSIVAAYLARQNPEAKILLTTFSDSLAANLRRRLKV